MHVFTEIYCCRMKCFSLMTERLRHHHVHEQIYDKIYSTLCKIPCFVLRRKVARKICTVGTYSGKNGIPCLPLTVYASYKWETNIMHLNMPLKNVGNYLDSVYVFFVVRSKCASIRTHVLKQICVQYVLRLFFLYCESHYCAKYLLLLLH